MKQRKPLNRVRPTPRRNDGRVQQERLRAKAGDKATPLEREHMARVASLPCLVCGRAATVHHVTGYADRAGRPARSHKCVVPLCPMHHQKVFDPKASDPVSVEGLNHRGFYLKHGIDLFAVGERLWKETIS